MNKKNKKRSGKELAKINKRKMFYSKLERYYSQVKKGEQKIIFLSRNKKNIFPESDEVTTLIDSNYIELEDEIEIEKRNSIEIVYMEELQFLIDALESKLISILRRELESKVEEKPEERTTSSLKDKNPIQAEYNWAISMTKKKKFETKLAKEKEEPSEHDMTPDKPVIFETFHYKSKKPPRRKRR